MSCARVGAAVRRRYRAAMGIIQVLDQLPEAVTRSPAQVWSVLARSLGEQGADGRTALAWRWTLTGACPSPVTLTSARDRPPVGAEILAEAQAEAELTRQNIDPGGQVMQARFVLRWLTGDIDALPLWNGGPNDRNVSEGAPYPHPRAEIEDMYCRALLAEERHPWCDASAPLADRMAFGSARGVIDLLAWVCGETSESPLSGKRVSDRPTLYYVSLDVCRGMTGVWLARRAGDLLRASRMESLMEGFLWLAGWNLAPPIDRHGHGTFETCPERDASPVAGAARPRVDGLT
jgi:hypothetical protein